jgi:uncharacterized protein (DUF58 family)
MANIADNISEYRELDNLEFLAKQVVEGFITGLHKSPYHGFSVEFAEHRLYNPGDSVKNMDWKVYARTGRLYTKRYDEETNLRCQLVIDASSSMFYPQESKQNKIRFSILSAAAIMYLMKRQRDAFGLSVFSEKVDIHTDARSTQVHRKLLLTYLEKVLKEEPKNKSTSAAASLHEIAENIHKRSLVVVFSDMMDNAEKQDEMFSALQHLKYNNHEVILFHVVDKSSEIDFKFDNRPYEFVDLETGEKLKLQPNQVKEFYVSKMQEYYQQLKLKCAQYKIDLVEADVQQPYKQVLLPYLMKRTKLY